MHHGIMCTSCCIMRVEWHCACNPAIVDKYYYYFKGGGAGGLRWDNGIKSLENHMFFVLSHCLPTWRKLISWIKRRLFKKIFASFSTLPISIKHCLLLTLLSVRAWSTVYWSSCWTTKKCWIQEIAFLEMLFHGFSGYLNWAFRIWSSISTS